MPTKMPPLLPGTQSRVEADAGGDNWVQATSSAEPLASTCNVASCNAETGDGRKQRIVHDLFRQARRYRRTPRDCYHYARHRIRAHVDGPDRILLIEALQRCFSGGEQA